MENKKNVCRRERQNAVSAGSRPETWCMRECRFVGRQPQRRHLPRRPEDGQTMLTNIISYIYIVFIHISKLPYIGTSERRSRFEYIVYRSCLVSFINTNDAATSGPDIKLFQFYEYVFIGISWKTLFCCFFYDFSRV